MRAATTCLAALALLIVCVQPDSANAHYLRHGRHDSHDTVLAVKHPSRRLDANAEAGDYVPELKMATINSPTAAPDVRPSLFREEADTLSRREHKGQAIHAVEPKITAPAIAERIQATQGASSSKRGGTCIGPICGLNLFFALIWVTFLVCAVVVYIVDRRYNQWSDNQAASGHAKRRASGVDVVRQATAYYQSAAASMNAKLLRRRPLS